LFDVVLNLYFRIKLPIINRREKKAYFIGTYFKEMFSDHLLSLSQFNCNYYLFLY